LTVDTWLDGSITSTTYQSTVWYSFPVTAGVEYRAWWNDLKSGDSTKTLDVKVSVYYSDGTEIFTNEDNGWASTYRPIKAYRTDTLKVKVVPYSSNQTGTFAVRYTSFNNDGSEANPYCLVSGKWLDGSIKSTNETVWYYFDASAGSTYYIWWNSFYDGPTPKNKTLDTDVSAYDPAGSAIFTSQSVGWTNPKPVFSVSQSGRIKIKVAPFYGTGTFAVVYSTSSTRP